MNYITYTVKGIVSTPPLSPKRGDAYYFKDTIDSASGHNDLIGVFGENPFKPKWRWIQPQDGNYIHVVVSDDPKKYEIYQYYSGSGLTQLVVVSLV